jgi:hypothetical protein
MPSTSHCAAGALLRIDNGKEKLIPSNPLRAKGLHEQMRPRKKSGRFSLRDRHFFSCLYVARLLDPWRRGRAGPGRGAWREEARGLPAGSWRRRKPTLCGPKRGGQGELWPEGGFGDRAGASLLPSGPLRPRVRGGSPTTCRLCTLCGDFFILWGKICFRPLTASLIRCMMLAICVCVERLRASRVKSGAVLGRALSNSAEWRASPRLWSLAVPKRSFAVLLPILAACLGWAWLKSRSPDRDTTAPDRLTKTGERSPDRAAAQVSPPPPVTKSV